MLLIRNRLQLSVTDGLFDLIALRLYNTDKIAEQLLALGRSWDACLLFSKFHKGFAFGPSFLQLLT